MTQQLTLTPVPTRQKRMLAPGCCHIPDWLTLVEQQSIIDKLRDWCRGHWFTPEMPNGTPMNHPLACLGWQWKPYEYFPGWCEVPADLLDLYARALYEALPEHEPLQQFTTPDTAIVNLFPVDSTLGMHQDRSESPGVREAGSPIVTLSLGLSAVFRLGNTWNKNRPYQDVELRSGDLLVMGGESRMAFHGVMRILPDTLPDGLVMRQPMRLSVTIRQCQVVSTEASPDPLTVTQSASPPELQPELQSFRVGDQVEWTDCSPNLEWLRPFRIKAIYDKTARLEWVAMEVPLSKLKPVKMRDIRR